MNITLRNWTNDDLNTLIHCANTPNISKFMCGIPYPYTTEYAQQFLAKTFENNPTNFQAICVDEIVVGSIGVHFQQGTYCKNMELGYWLAEAFWNKGIITKAIPKMVDYAFNNFDITRVFARVFAVNKPSEKVLIKNGFKLEANFEKTLYKDGVFYDELIYAIRK